MLNILGIYTATIETRDEIEESKFRKSIFEYPESLFFDVELGEDVVFLQSFVNKETISSEITIYLWKILIAIEGEQKERILDIMQKGLKNYIDNLKELLYKEPNPQEIYIYNEFFNTSIL